MRFMKKLVITMLCAGILLIWGCGAIEETTAQNTKDSKAAETVSFKDALGQEVTVTAPERTAVLSGSFADAWVLAGGKLYAATDDAGEVMSLPEDTVMLGALKSPNMEVMIAEGIDFAVLSSTIAEHVELRDTLENAGITTAYFEVETFQDYEAMMKIMTDITGKEDLFQKNVTDIRSEIDSQIARADGSTKTVLFLRAYSTGVKAKGSDSMTGRMLKDLGCVNIADGNNGLLSDLSMEAIIQADPDYIFVTTMGESKEKALTMVEELLTNNSAWEGLKAVKDNHYYVLPKELFHNKPNEQWGESYHILADYLYGKNDQKS